MVEQTKQLSKNELKRLAKKEAREAEKKQKGGAPAAGNDGAPKAKGGGKNVPAPAAEAPTAPKTEIPSLPTSNIYYLANVTNEECPAALKSAVAASAFGITLCRPAVTPSSLPSIFTGPALYANSNTNTVAFGGNGVAKALAALITSTFTASDNVMIDEWLEFERTSLRCAKAKQAAKTLAKLESGLSGGNFLVGKQLSIADIVMVVTLASDKDAIPTYPSAIQSYLNVHLSSPAFINGKEMVKSLVPPPPFDYTNNPSMVRAVNDVFYTAISTLLPQVATTLGKDNDGIFMEKSKILKNGDYQCKEAMPLFSLLKSQNALPNGVLTPMDLAQNIANMIPIDNPICDSFKVNRPGFILCKIKASYLESHLNSFMNSTDTDTDADNEAKDPKLTLPWNIRESKQTVVVDFSSPNIAKEMHVGHLRSTIIGESVCRILELCGADVKRVNHVGDWGTQFGMLITYLKETHPDFAKKGGNGGDVAISDLTKIYKQAKIRFDEDEEFKKTSQLNVVNLQAGDQECRDIWNVLCDISRREFEKVYRRLDITLDECGESFYNDKIPPVLEEFEKSGLIQESNGAKCVFLDNFKIPLMLQKSDGGFGYDSTDMAALKYRINDLGASRVVCITDFSQGDHFHMIFAAGKKAGWVNDKQHKLEHIGFGTVMGEDGKRFKTRSGDTVRLVDLLDEAVKRMEESLTERIKEGKSPLTLEEVHDVAATMGYGAVKYFDLRRNPTTNYKFSYDEMLDTKGNTAIYLLYAHARLESIITKGKTEPHNIDVDALVKNKTATMNIGEPSERILALHLQMFADVIEETLKDLYPYRICEYLYALANAVSDFVTQCKVLGSPEMEKRLLLCRASTIVMRQCFTLLGIGHVQRI